MTTWIIPEGSDETGDAADGDLLARPEGEELHVGRVAGDNVEWFGAAPVETIVLPDVTEPEQASQELARQLEAFAEALSMQGG